MCGFRIDTWTNLLTRLDTPLGECLDVLVDWKRKGLIGNIGIGVRQPDFHKRAIETGEIDVLLSFLDYTLLSQSYAEITIPLALKHDVGIILGSPLPGSLLAGPEPVFRGNKNIDDKLPPAAIGSPLDPSVAP